MADISKIKTPNGNEYNIKDTTCRSDISDLTTSVGGLQSRVTTIENDGLVEITTSEIDDIIGSYVGGSSGGSGGYVWQDGNGYVHLSDAQGTQITVESLSATSNTTYTAPTGKAYSPVVVNVPTVTITQSGSNLSIV